MAASSDSETTDCIAARPSPTVELGPSEVSLSSEVIERLDTREGEVVSLRTEDHQAWATVQDHGATDSRLVRLGRMLWPQLSVRPGEVLHIEALGELPEAKTARITPPYNLTFKIHERLLEKLRDDRTPLYPGNRVLSEIYPGGAGMMVRIDLASPAPSRMVDTTEVELHKADVAVSERVIGLADVGGADCSSPPASRARRTAAAAAGVLPAPRRSAAQGRLVVRASRHWQDTHLQGAGERARSHRVPHVRH